MTRQKPIKPEYQAWRRRIEGQIRHMMNEHPEFFNLPTVDAKERCIRSMAKRIIGEIVAGTATGNSSGASAILRCDRPDGDTVERASAVSLTASETGLAGRQTQQTN